MNDAGPLDLSPIERRADAIARPVPGHNMIVTWRNSANDVPALIAEVRRLRELQEDTAAENARLSAWWHAMRRGGLA